jgi:hypothetical protein
MSEVVINEAFKGVGQAPGLVSWSLKSFQLSRLDSDQHGTFFSG